MNGHGRGRGRGRGTAACILALLVTAAMQGTAQAQRQQPRASDNRSVRAELAAVLLQSKKYDEAAREYRLLLNGDPGNFTYRLGLARALAWGKRPREAEQELRTLNRQRPNHAEVAALLHTVREALDPSSVEAGQWLAERPGHVPYRRALARALMREGNARGALPHYEALLAIDTSVALLREAVYVQVEANEHARAALLLQRALECARGDTALRHNLARVLSAAKQYDAAAAQYDSLIAWQPTPALLLERAQLNLSRGDFEAAESDAHASIRAKPSGEAWLLVGNVRRWRGDFEEAARAYNLANMLLPDDERVVSARAHLAREARPALAFLPAWTEPAGWLLRSTAVSDNQDLIYTTLGARRSVDVRYGVVGHIDVEVRRLAERSADLSAGVAGFALALGATRDIAYGPFLARLGARAGTVFHSDVSMVTGALSAAGWLNAWGVSLEYAGGPAYTSLFSLASILPDVDDEPLSERTITVAAGGPVGPADAALSLQRSDQNDDNRRTTAQALLRVPMALFFSALYSGTGTWFAERSDRYWDPESYSAHSGGIEIGARNPEGLSAGVRVLAGIARSTEFVRPARGPLEEVELSALQFTGGADISYRSPAGQIGAAVTYGSGRAGSYRRLELSLFGRLLH